ncbi:unnamed protein product [Moneuplotes crassus]|uniref:Uncharacterized protein n=1 Tax=Euplotes crassus TaxID=5936 RepID=A0AAD1TZP0_EUPCR|nr:unnamed protein product [Moneuplotes crassus]
MKFPICEARPCKDRSQFYIIERKLYVCNTHKVAKYFTDDSIHLVPQDSVESLLKVIDQCRKELLVSPITQGYLGSEEEYNGFDTTIREAVDHISSSLRAVVLSKQFFKLEALFIEAKQLEDFIMNHELFIKHSTAKSWKEALGVVNEVVEKSSALVTKELHEEYASLFKRTADELRKQRTRILEEKSRLDIKLSEEKNKVKDLKEELKNQEKSLKQDMKMLKDQYEEKIEGLINTQSQLEQTKSTLIDEAEQKDQQISELKEDIKSKSEDLERSHERIQNLEQKVKTKTEKEKELKEQIENLKSNFDEEKEKLEENYESELRQHKRRHDIMIEESNEKSEKKLQEQLAVFNNKYKEKDDAIHKLEEEASKLTEDLDQQRTEHQALIATHTNLQKEKQSIVEKHSEDTSKLQQNNEALEEESKAKDINIMELKEEIEELTRKLKDACEHNESIKQNLVSLIQTFSNQEVTDFLKDCEVYDEYSSAEEEIQFDQKTCLYLDLNKENHLEFLTKITKRIPDCEYISIGSIPGENEVVKTFLSLYFPNKVKQFYFNERSALSSCLSFYMTELEALSSKVEEKFGICNFEVSQNQMKTLLAKYKRKSWFGFVDCNLALSSVPDFGGALQGSQLERLDLTGCGASARGGWKNNPSHFENLIEGLAKEQDFKNNLKMIWMGGCGMEKSQVEEILKKYEFGEVQIWM